MRNLGTRINESNIINVYGQDLEELKYARGVLEIALEVGASLTPSEERIISSFVTWYHSIDSNRPYHSDNPAYVYLNLNTGFPLVFLIAIPYEGCRGGRSVAELQSDWVSAFTVEVFD